jgi:hypothetical protein
MVPSNYQKEIYDITQESDLLRKKLLDDPQSSVVFSQEILFLLSITRHYAKPDLLKKYDVKPSSLASGILKEISKIINNPHQYKPLDVNQILRAYQLENNYFPIVAHESLAIIAGIYNLRLEGIRPISSMLYSIWAYPVELNVFRLRVSTDTIPLYILDPFTGAIDPIFLYLLPHKEHINIALGDHALKRICSIIGNHKNTVQCISLLRLRTAVLWRQSLRHDRTFNCFWRYKIHQIFLSVLTYYLKLANLRFLSDYFLRICLDKTINTELQYSASSPRRHIYLTWFSPSNTPPSLAPDFPLSLPKNSSITLLQHRLSQSLITQLCLKFDYIDPITDSSWLCSPSESTLISIPTSNILIALLNGVPSKLLMSLEKGFNPKWLCLFNSKPIVDYLFGKQYFTSIKGLSVVLFKTTTEMEDYLSHYIPS